MSRAMPSHLLWRSPARLPVMSRGHFLCCSLSLCCCLSRWAFAGLRPISMGWALLLIICHVVGQVSHCMVWLGIRGRQLICQTTRHSLGLCYLDDSDCSKLRSYRKPIPIKLRQK